MKVAYIRVSTGAQHTDRQYELLKDCGIERYFEEKISGKNIVDRQKLQEMLDFVREGDEVYVCSFDRLARSTKDLLMIVEDLIAKKVSLISLHENLDSRTAQGKLMLTMFGAFAEFERACILQRQAEGILAAREAGRYAGRKPIEIDSATFEKEYNRYLSREINKTQLAKALKVSRPTADKMIKEYKERNIAC